MGTVRKRNQTVNRSRGTAFNLHFHLKPHGTVTVTVELSRCAETVQRSVREVAGLCAGNVGAAAVFCRCCLLPTDDWAVILRARVAGLLPA